MRAERIPGSVTEWPDAGDESEFGFGPLLVEYPRGRRRADNIVLPVDCCHIKGTVKAYLERFSGFSRAQITRLLLKCLLDGAIRPLTGRRNRFPTKYADADKRLLAQTDNAHGRLSGPATKRILERIK